MQATSGPTSGPTNDSRTKQGQKIMSKRSAWWKFVVAAASTAVVGPALAGATLVNGGFESGDFTGWTGTGDTTFNGVQCPGPGPAVHEGNCSAFFGPFLSVGGIAQSVDFGSAGVPWQLSFAFQSDGGSPSSLTVLFGGSTLLSLADPQADAYTLYRFSGVSTGATQILAFGFFDPPGFLSLDAVSLAVPEPSTMGLLAAGATALFVRRRRTKA